MVRHCAWGACTADSRYPEKMTGKRFITFPNPKTKLEMSLRWIKACGRPHHQLNVSRINKNKVICSTHFVGGNGPTIQYPDPIPADGTHVTPSRPPPKRRRLDFMTTNVMDPAIDDNKNNIIMYTPGLIDTDSLSNTCDFSCQTDEDSKTILMEEEINNLKREISRKNIEINSLKAYITQNEKTMNRQQTFSAEGIMKRGKEIKDIFVYYTGISYVNFLFLLMFLFPNTNEKIKYGRKDAKNITNENAVFLLLCRLRHDFGLKDLAIRFNLSVQSTSTVFNKILDLLYFKFGQISLWPHRDVIISRMPKEFKKDFPTTLILIDGTEFETQVPNALGLQSQMYSDYKSSTTLKALIGCDPSGTVIFISELFTGSISDKSICDESGFYELLKHLKEHGYVQNGDGIMADKGFTIHDELNKLGLKLNIPPFSSSSQMSPADTYLTQKIAKHRVHIERVIAKVKTYKLLSHRIPTSLFKQANIIWTACAIMTLHQKIFVKDK